MKRSFLPLLLAPMLLAGCGGPSGFKAEASSAAADIFAKACAACHGQNGSGKFGFLLKIAGSRHTAAELATKIEKGGFIMPGFPVLTPEQRMAVAEFVKAQ